MTVHGGPGELRSMAVYGNGSLWEWKSMGMAVYGNGSLWEWQSMGMAV